jgi:hypothetical protein
MAANAAVNILLESVEEVISDINGIERKSQVKNKTCTHQFGYLANLPDNSFLPKECLLCSKVIQCILYS